jgi:hypothetical protein
MGLIDGQRRKLIDTISPHLEPAERIDGQLTYGATKSYGAWVGGSLAKSLVATMVSPDIEVITEDAFGVVVTSDRVFFAKWDSSGNPHAVGHLPRAQVGSEGLKVGWISGSIDLLLPEGARLHLEAMGPLRYDVRTLDNLLGSNAPRTSPAGP